MSVDGLLAVWRAVAMPRDGDAVDPATVGARMAMYRFLVERGGLDELSPFWGYAQQLHWQHTSGRLGARAIEAGSWWGACNYALSVVPYVAAMDVGIVPRLRFAELPGDYAHARGRWREAFLLFHAPDDLDLLRLAVWRAHLASIDAAVARHQGEYLALPAAERRFARGWVRMVDLFGAAGWRTDLARLREHGVGALPSRVLDDAAALPDDERRTVRQVFALADRPPWRWSIDTAVWRRMMRTRAAREDSGALLGALMGRGGWRARMRALRVLW